MILISVLRKCLTVHINRSAISGGLRHFNSPIILSKILAEAKI